VNFTSNQQTDEGVIRLDGRVRDSELMAELQKSLRDPQHAIIPTRNSELEDAENGYSWEFTSDIKVRGAPPAPSSSPARPGLQPRAATQAKG
jgi:hypothetical protein